MASALMERPAALCCLPYFPPWSDSPSARTRAWRSVPHLASEFVSKSHADYPRPCDGLRRNELRARSEYALDHIGQILAVQLRRPRIRRDADRRVVLGERGIFKPYVRRAHVRACR